MPKHLSRVIHARLERLLEGRFGLLRYFTLTSFVAFAIVGGALLVLQGMEEDFFAQVQDEQSAFIARVQSELAQKQDEAARASLLDSHEAAHVNLTQVLANVLWASDFAPFVARVQQLPIDACRALPARGAAAASGAQDARRACFAELGRMITGLPGFDELDAKAYAAMRASSVFKIKVFDLRGITVYSSEHAQIGEDKADNLGWITAVTGKPASEMTHRDRFSTFEGVVEDRDLISSYLPVHAPGRDDVVGVFEIYSDVTGFLAGIREVSAETAKRVADNQAVVAQTAADNRRKVHESSVRFLTIVGGLLVLLYLALLLLVRIGQGVIDRQAIAQERAAAREERWYREKMAALATMAANVSHEVGNPLAVITMHAQGIRNEKARGGCDACEPEKILEQTQRIASMTRHITEFAAANRDSSQLINVNHMLKAILDFFSFDHDFGALKIEFEPDANLPAYEAIPDHLNEILMNLLQVSADWLGAQDGNSGRIVVQTKSVETGIGIRIECACLGGQSKAPPPYPTDDSRFDVVRRRVAGMGGAVRAMDAAVEIDLPCVAVSMKG